MVRWCLLAAFISVAPFVTAQLDGQFYLEKSSFARGEPVFLFFEVKNTGARSENYYQASPYSFCSGYDINITGPKPKKASCEPWGVAGSCGSSDIALSPGQNSVERILLNFEHDVDTPGQYTIEVIRRFPSMIGSTSLQDRNHQYEVHDTLYFHVEESSASPESFQPWIEQLKENDLVKRLEAARVLASLAPRSLENVILPLTADPQFRGFAPLALHRLDTSRSLAAMAELLRTSQPGSSESMDSDRYLADTGDQQWFPLMRDIAVKNAGNLPYMGNAARLGGDNMVPTLVTLLSSPQPFARANAVTSLSYTGSRAAVPVLIELLKADKEIAERAAASLHELTHRRADGNPQEQYAKWVSWWARERDTAPIYRIEDCGDSVLLP